MATSSTKRPADPTLRQALKLAAVFALVKLLLQFALTLYTEHLGYSYFRDEFYYLACGHHLAWGFVDHGPIVALQARLGELLFGNSVFAIRVLSAVAGALTIFLTGMLVWAMNGARPAQSLAMLAMLLSPHYIAVDGYLSMNSFEPVFWMLCAFAIFMLVRGARIATWWIVFGASAGLGLLNKPSMTFFLIAVLLGLLSTKQRRILGSPWAAIGVVLLIAIALPNLLWQIHNHWPTLEFLQNGRQDGKNTVLNPPHFFLAQFAMLGPINVLVWIVGLIALLRAKSIPNGRWMGLTYLFFYIIMDASHAKDYYLGGIYPALFAAGGVAWERRYALTRPVVEQRIIAFPVLQTILLVTGALILPMASPVLAPATWVRYTTSLHLQGSKNETAAAGPLPQFFADRFGWQQLATQVVGAYTSLSPDDRKIACIVASNYGEASVVDLLGKKLEPSLPPAVSPHNSYWMWGTHGCTWQVVIYIGDATLADMQQRYESVQIVGNLDDPYAMPFEHRPVFLCRRRKPSMPVNWQDWKSYM